MASDDPLSMSLDDIIKMKRQGRRGGRSKQRGRGRGKPRGRGGMNTGNTEQYTDFSRGQQGAAGRRGHAAGGGRGFGNRGRGRGLRVLTTKFGVKGASQGRNTASLQGNRFNKGRRGRGFITTGRGGIDMSNYEGRGRGRVSVIQRIRSREQYANDFQMRDMASASGRQFAKARLQQPQGSMSTFQQLNRKKNRNDVINQRRGIPVGMKTSGNLGAPLRVRVGSGTIVRGLRSDQLLLQKIRQSKKTQVQAKLETFREKRDRSQNARDSSLDSNSIVSLSSHRGLTVSIKNNIASHSVRNGTTSRSRPRISRHKMKKSQDNMFAPATFTIVNDHVNSYDSDFEMLPDPTRRITKRNIITTRDPRPRNTVSLSIGSDNMRSLPEPHRQILDPKIQKEIAMLQGKEEVTLNSGPGPGVKGFRHVPSQTTRSLNERFTNERLVTV